MNDSTPCQIHLTVKRAYSKNLVELHRIEKRQMENQLPVKLTFLWRAITIDVLLLHGCQRVRLHFDWPIAAEHSVNATAVEMRNAQQNLGTEMNTCLITPSDKNVTQLCVLKRKYLTNTSWEPMTSPGVITKECTLFLSVAFAYQIRPEAEVLSHCWLKAWTNGVEHVFVSFDINCHVLAASRQNQ